jgi:hypothetical protein
VSLIARRSNIWLLTIPDMDQSFIDPAGSLTWRELRPLRDYVADGSEICLRPA